MTNDSISLPAAPSRPADSVDAVVPDATGHFGRYGGRFVPEALIAALDELDDDVPRRAGRPGVHGELNRLLRDYTGRPSPLTDVAKFGAHAGGARILLKREDLNHTGSHKINNVLGQALLTQRMGKKRVIAETGAGQHGVATATAAALLGLDCTVYMGEEDTRRQALNVARMRLLGAEVVPVTTGSRTLKDAINEAMRDWVTNVDAHQLRLRDGRRPASVPADGARVPARHRRRGARAGARAGRPAARCRGGLRRRRLQRDRDLHRLRARRRRAADRFRGGRRRRRDRPARGDDHRRDARACCTARAPTCCRTTTARPSSRTRSRPASTTPASAPSTPTCTTSAAPSTARSPTPRRWTRSRLLSQTEGIIPAIESAHALAGALELGRELGPDAVILVNLSGRGDKDVETASKYFGLVVGMTADVDVVRADARLATARAEGRAALIGYLPVGYPDVETSIAAMRALVAGGGDIVEVGVPYSDPGMDGPTIQQARRARGAGRGCARRRAARRPGRRRRRRGGGRHVVLEPDRPVRRRAVRRRPRRGWWVRGDHARSDPRRGRRLDRGERRARAGPDLPGRAVARPTRASRSTAAACRGFVYAAVDDGRHGYADGGRRPRPSSRRPVPEPPATSRCASGSGSRTATRPPRSPAFADGVIVGSAFVRRLLDRRRDAVGGRGAGRELAARPSPRERPPPGWRPPAHGSADEQLAGRAAALQVVVGLRRVGRVGSARRSRSSARRRPSRRSTFPERQSSSSRVGDVVRQRRTGDEQRTGRVEPLQVERRHLAARRAEQRQHAAARSDASEASKVALPTPS